MVWVQDVHFCRYLCRTLAPVGRENFGRTLQTRTIESLGDPIEGAIISSGNSINNPSVKVVGTCTDDIDARLDV